MLSGVAYGQTPTIQVWISGDLTVTTSESLTLNTVKVKGLMHRDSIRSGDHHVLFCITHANPIASKLNYTGPGRVVYRTARSGRSATKEPAAEKMLPALGVLQADGETLFFLAEGAGYPHPPNERSVGTLATFVIVNIVRHEVRNLHSKREKAEVLSCAESKPDDHLLAHQSGIEQVWRRLLPVVSGIRRVATSSSSPLADDLPGRRAQLSRRSWPSCGDPPSGTAPHRPSP
jgi:hypothetical protein